MHCITGFLTLPTAYVTGNPVECVVHPDLWNKTSLWDPLGIGRVRVDSLSSQESSLDDEFVEENYGAPINTVSMSPCRLSQLGPNLSSGFPPDN